MPRSSPAGTACSDLKQVHELTAGLVCSVIGTIFDIREPKVCAKSSTFLVTILLADLSFGAKSRVISVNLFQSSLDCFPRRASRGDTIVLVQVRCQTYQALFQGICSRQPYLLYKSGEWSSPFECSPILSESRKRELQEQVARQAQDNSKQSESRLCHPNPIESISAITASDDIRITVAVELLRVQPSGGSSACCVCTLSDYTESSLIEAAYLGAKAPRDHSGFAFDCVFWNANRDAIMKVDVGSFLLVVGMHGRMKFGKFHFDLHGKPSESRPSFQLLTHAENSSLIERVLRRKPNPLPLCFAAQKRAPETTLEELLLSSNSWEREGTIDAEFSVFAFFPNSPQSIKEICYEKGTSKGSGVFVFRFTLAISPISRPNLQGYCLVDSNQVAKNLIGDKILPHDLRLSPHSCHLIHEAFECFLQQPRILRGKISVSPAIPQENEPISLLLTEVHSVSPPI